MRDNPSINKPDRLRPRDPPSFEQSMLSTAKGGGILALGRFFEFGGRFVIAFLLARLLGAEQYGLCALAISAATIFAGVSALGLDSAMVRYVAMLASKRDEAGLWGALQIGIGCASCASLLMGIGLYVLARPLAENVFQEPQLVPLLQVLSLLLPFLTLSNVLVGVAHGFKRMDYSVIAENFVRLLFRLLLVVVLAVVGLNAFQVAIVFGLSDLAASVVLVYLLNKEFSLNRPLRTGRRDLREISSYSLPLWLSGLLKKFRRNIQTILLGTLSTMAHVGVFSLVSRVNLIGRVSYRSIIASVKPVFAELFARGEWEQMGRLYKTTTRWTFMVNLPMFLMFVMYPEPILSIFGQSFLHGASALTVLACAELAIAITGTCGSIIDMTGYTKIKLANSVIWLALLLGLNFVLIPRWGVLGAAIAILVATTTVNFLRVLEVWLLFKLFPYDLSFFKPIASSVVALTATLVVDWWLPAETNLFYVGLHVTILFSGYAGMLFLLGFAPDDRKVLARVSRRANSLISKYRALWPRHLPAR